MSRDNYIRVLPRDLFNEAKLLKCLGKLILLIEDKMAGDLTYSHNGGSFYIKQNISGDLYCKNIYFNLGERIITFHTPLNSKHPWPLIALAVAGSWYDSIEVFNDEGELTEFFKSLINKPTVDLIEKEMESLKVFKKAFNKFKDDY